jgi:hypothetical protein
MQGRPFVSNPASRTCIARPLMLLTMRERMPGGSGRGERAETSMWTMAALTGLWASAKPPIAAAEAVKNSPLRERLGAASANLSALRLGLDCSDTFASSAPTSRDDLSKKNTSVRPASSLGEPTSDQRHAKGHDDRIWHETDVLCVPTNVCSWGKSGRAADITAMTEVDPKPTWAGLKSRTAAVS